MRFLQTEWHRHERDRNAWEIERAEMKSRIGRLEGDVRTSKRLRESLAKHVRLLEAALKKERERSKKLGNDEKVDDMRDPKDIARESLNAVKGIPIQEPRLSGIHVFADSCSLHLAQHPKPRDPFDADGDETQPEFRQETERDKSRLYLSKCSQEVVYHVIPASHPPQDLADQEDMSNNHHMYGNQPMSQQSLEEAYLHQQRQKQQQQQQQGNHMMREVLFQPVVQYTENPGMARGQNQYGNLPATREDLDRRSLDAPQTAMTAGNDRKNQLDHPYAEEPTGAPAQTIEEYGAQGPPREAPPPAPQDTSDDADGWNFDEPSEQEPSSEQIPPHRPDTDAFPNANFVGSKSPSRGGSLSHRRKSSESKSQSEATDSNLFLTQKQEINFRVRFALRGHLDVIRSVIFTGGGSPSEPEVCTSSDDGTIKRWIIPAMFGPGGLGSTSDMDITSYFTHRGHSGAVTALAAWSPSQHFLNGGRALGDGWVFSGGQDASVRVWERGRVDPKATLDGHTDAVWALCVLPGTTGTAFGEESSRYGGPDRILLASGGADGKVLIWAVSSPPQVSSPQAGNRRAGGSRRANSISSGSNFPSSPQPSIATTSPFHYTLIHQIVRPESPSPTCISPLSPDGVNFVVSYSDASIIVYDTRTGEEISGMASLETYDGTPSTGVNAVVASTVGFDGTANLDPHRTLAAEEEVHGATGSSGVEGVLISGYEDRYIRFFDANSGMYFLCSSQFYLEFANCW